MDYTEVGGGIPTRPTRTPSRRLPHSHSSTRKSTRRATGSLASPAGRPCPPRGRSHAARRRRRPGHRGPRRCRLDGAGAARCAALLLVLLRGLVHRVEDAEIVLGVLEIALRHHAVARASSVPPELQVFLEQLLRGAAHAHVRAVAVEDVVTVKRDVAAVVADSSAATPPPPPPLRCWRPRIRFMFMRLSSRFPVGGLGVAPRRPAAGHA